MGYGVACGGRDAKGALYRTRDGKSWRVLLGEFFPDGRGSEGSLAFGKDDRAYCLFRLGERNAAIGTGKAPYYQEWDWKKLTIDWTGDGDARSGEDVLRAPFGGPKIICLGDGRLRPASLPAPPARAARAG